MKAANITLLLSFLIGVLTSCSDLEKVPAENRGITFEFSLSDPNSNSRAFDDFEGYEDLLPVCTDAEIDSIYMKILSADTSEVVFEGKLPTQWFPATQRYQTVIDKLLPGDYLLANAIALDSGNNPIFAAPHQGSKYAFLVEEPLFKPFTIFQGEKVVNKIRLLCVYPGEIPNFGVKVFEIGEDLISIFRIYFFSNKCLDSGHVKAETEVIVELPIDLNNDGENDTYPSTVVEGLTCVFIPDIFTKADSLETLKLTVFVHDTCLVAHTTVEELKQFENNVVHLFYDCYWIPDWLEYGGDDCNGDGGDPDPDPDPDPSECEDPEEAFADVTTDHEPSEDPPAEDLCVFYVNLFELDGELYFRMKIENPTNETYDFRVVDALLSDPDTEQYDDVLGTVGPMQDVYITILADRGFFEARIDGDADDDGEYEYTKGEILEIFDVTFFDPIEPCIEPEP